MEDESLTLKIAETESLTDEERDALHNLAQNISIIISEAEKVNAVFIQDKNEHISKLCKL